MVSRKRVAIWVLKLAGAKLLGNPNHFGATELGVHFFMRNLENTSQNLGYGVMQSILDRDILIFSLIELNIIVAFLMWFLRTASHFKGSRST